jgi:hypothetical protein
MVFIQQLGPCRFHSWRPTNANMNKILMKVKERTKLVNYYSHFLLRNPDRYMCYEPLGGPNQGRFFVRQSKSQKQFEHYNTRHDKCNSFYNERFRTPHHTISGVFIWTWVGTYGVSDQQFRSTDTGTLAQKDRSALTQVLESWGSKTVQITDHNSPRIESMMVHRHNLYQHNFPWIKDPITTHEVGDADYSWKERDEFDYGKTRAKDHAAFNHSVMAGAEPAVAKARGLAPVAEGKAAKKA